MMVRYRQPFQFREPVRIESALRFTHEILDQDLLVGQAVSRDGRLTANRRNKIPNRIAMPSEEPGAIGFRRGEVEEIQPRLRYNWRCRPERKRHRLLPP